MSEIDSSDVRRIKLGKRLKPVFERLGEGRYIGRLVEQEPTEKLFLESKDRDMLSVDLTYADELIVDVNGEAIGLTLEQVKLLLEHVGDWVKLSSGRSVNVK